MLVREEKAVQITRLMNREIPYVLFRTEDTGEHILLAHGDEDGRVHISDWVGTPAQFLDVIFEQNPSAACDVLWLGCFCGRIDPQITKTGHTVRGYGEYYSIVNITVHEADHGWAVQIIDFCPMDIEREWKEYRVGGPKPCIKM